MEGLSYPRSLLIQLFLSSVLRDLLVDFFKETSKRKINKIKQNEWMIRLNE